ncbi:hypothetical protein KIPB_013178, partial [Kipferlia bialata]|eukprot:g13178.t1
MEENRPIVSRRPPGIFRCHGHVPARIGVRGVLPTRSLYTREVDRCVLSIETGKDRARARKRDRARERARGMDRCPCCDKLVRAHELRSDGTDHGHHLGNSLLAMEDFDAWSRAASDALQ